MNQLREALAELEHDQWIAWSKNIAETEVLNRTRKERWEKLWRPYAELTEAEKDQDRVWADKVMFIYYEGLRAEMARLTGMFIDGDVGGWERGYASAFQDIILFLSVVQPKTAK